MKKLILSLFVICPLIHTHVYFEQPGHQVPTNVSQPGVGVLTLRGSIRSSRGALFKKQLYELIHSPLVQGIILVIDSGGGSATLSHELADLIKSAKMHKPIVSYVESYCASGAYLIASITPIVASSMAEIGSIGVIIEFEQRTAKEFKQDGIKGEIERLRFKWGKFKQLGRDKLKPEDEAEIQKDGLFHYEAFCSRVAQERGLSLEAVKATEALLFPAPIALQKGLIDGIGTITDALKVLKSELSKRGTVIPESVDLMQSLILPE